MIHSPVNKVFGLDHWMSKEINEIHPRQDELTRCISAAAKWRSQQEVFWVGRRHGEVVE